jgi:hypothetical protein
VYASEQAEQIVKLLQQNTALTELTKSLSERIESLTIEVRNKLEKV